MNQILCDNRSLTGTACKPTCWIVDWDTKDNRRPTYEYFVYSVHVGTYQGIHEEYLCGHKILCLLLCLQTLANTCKLLQLLWCSYRFKKLLRLKSELPASLISLFASLMMSFSFFSSSFPEKGHQLKTTSKAKHGLKA